MFRFTNQLAMGLALLGLLSSCLHDPAHGALPPKATAGSASSDEGKDPDGDLSEEWMASSLPEEQVVSREEATEFVAQVFSRVNAKIFDEAFFQAERAQAKALLLEALSRTSALTRGELAGLIDTELQKTGMSHLRLLPPGVLRRLGERLEQQQQPQLAQKVSARMIGDVGIVRIPSFLVPEISLEEVTAAFRAVAGAGAVLLDLRGNGGGSISSVTYVAQHLLGPNRTVQLSKTRSGMSRKVPFVFASYFPDDQNRASAADVALERHEGYVEWRTPDAVTEVLSVPKFLLIDSGCGSSCEAFAAAIREHHAATLIGEGTRGGLLGSVLYKSAWPGFALLVPMAATYSPSGALVEGVGVPVDTSIEACVQAKVPEADRDRRSAECLEEALRLVRRDLQPNRATGE